MKTHTLLRAFLTAVSLAVALAFPPRDMGAEDKPTAPSKTPSGGTESTLQGYDLEITDGKLVGALKGRGLEATLGSVVDALRDRYTKANIAMSPGLAKLKISDIKLRAGHLADELEAIRVASGSKFDWMGPGSPGPNMLAGQAVDPTTGMPIATAPNESNTGLFVLREPTPTAETARTVEAFNIGPYLQMSRERLDPKEVQDRLKKEVPERLDELEKIIAITLDSLKQGSSVEMPSFRFHQGANLLVVVGTRDAVDVARKVVNALPGQAGFANFGGGEGSSGGVGVPVPPSESDAAAAAFRERYGMSRTPGAPRITVPPR